MELHTSFIEELPHTKPLYVSVYLYAKHHATNGKLALSVTDYSNLFNVLETDIVAAFQHWQAKMFLHLKFAPLLEIEFIEEAPVTVAPVTSVPEEAEEETPQNLVFLNTSLKPTYSPMELEMYKNKYGNIAHIFNIAEKSLGRLLSSSELSTIFSFYDWLRLPIDVIEILLQYCASNGHRNINYIESVAIDWSENKITTVEAAQNHIQSYNKNYRAVLKAIGQGNREASTKERKLIDKWMTEYQFTLDIILEACDKTIMSIGTPKLSYTDSILESWFKADVKCIADIIKLDNHFKEANKDKQKEIKPSKQTTQNSKFANYTSSNSIDYSELENVEMKLMKNLFKG